MYDFYGKPPRTKAEIRDYLTSWLKKPTDATFLTYEGETFAVEYGFRRAFYDHIIYRSLSTNEYIWWVTEDGDLRMFPARRYPSLEALIEDVVNGYFTRWN